MNLYAPNSALEREGVWLSLCDYASLADGWLMGGDFNMIQDVVDRMGGITTLRMGSCVGTTFILPMVCLIYGRCIHFHVCKDPFNFLDQKGVWLLQICLYTR